MPPRTFHLHAGIQPDDPDALASGLRSARRGNHGLRFERYFGQWDRAKPHKLRKKDIQVDGIQRWKGVEDPLQEWLAPGVVENRYTVGALSCGNSELLAEYQARRAAMIVALAGVMVSARLISPLAIGLGSPHPLRNAAMTWHFTLGVPYLPGSGLKQVAQDCAERWSERCAEPCELARIFGAPEAEGKPGSAGTVMVLDGLPAEPVTVTADITTSHYGPYYAEDPETVEPRAPGDWFSPNPVTFPVVREGSLFHFAALTRRPNDPDAARDLRLATAWLMEGLEILGAGARTGAAGLGRFAPAERPGLDRSLP
jgi:CRISPR-associated protein Cmr6